MVFFKLTSCCSIMQSVVTKHDVTWTNTPLPLLIDLPWSQPGWKSFRYRHQSRYQSSLARWSCCGDGSSQARASHQQVPRASEDGQKKGLSGDSDRPLECQKLMSKDKWEHRTKIETNSPHCLISAINMNTKITVEDLLLCEASW